jgi:hypothetical protein
LIAALVIPAVATAQEGPRYEGVALSAGPSVVGASNRFVGAQAAPHLQLSVGRRLGPGLAGAAAFDVFVMPTVTSQPGCAIPEGDVDVYCGARTERAGALLGVTLEARWYPWRNGIGVSGGVGAFYAPSVHGPVASTGTALMGGAEYQLFSESSGWRPVIGIRATRLLADVGGIRWTVSPTAGVRF